METYMAFVTVSGPVSFVLKCGSPGSIVDAAIEPVKHAGSGR